MSAKQACLIIGAGTTRDQPLHAPLRKKVWLCVWCAARDTLMRLKHWRNPFETAAAKPLQCLLMRATKTR